MRRAFRQVDVFTAEPYLGNPLAVVHDADGLGVVVQQCGAGLVPVRSGAGGLAFAAPPLVRSGPVEEELAARVTGALRVDPGQVADMRWADNGPGWIGVLLHSAGAVLGLRPGPTDLDIGVAGPHPPGGPADFEVRTFFPGASGTVEDPVTGSFNASLAQWLIGCGRARAPYTARQGTALGRRGLVRVQEGEDGQVWVGGDVVTCVTGTVAL